MSGAEPCPTCGALPCDQVIRQPLSESVAESLLRQLFEGDVQVALAGNPVTCERLEGRIRAYFDWKGPAAK